MRHKNKITLHLQLRAAVQHILLKKKIVEGIQPVGCCCHSFIIGGQTFNGVPLDDSSKHLTHSIY